MSRLGQLILLEAGMLAHSQLSPSLLETDLSANLTKQAQKVYLYSEQIKDQLALKMHQILEYSSLIIYICTSFVSIPATQHKSI